MVPLVSSVGVGEGKEMGVVKTLSPKAHQTPQRLRSEVRTQRTASEKGTAQGSKRMKFPEKEQTCTNDEIW